MGSKEEVYILGLKKRIIDNYDQGICVSFKESLNAESFVCQGRYHGLSPRPEREQERERGDLRRGPGWRIHGSVEDTKLSTNKQHSLSSFIRNYQRGPEIQCERDVVYWYLIQ